MRYTGKITNAVCEQIGLDDLRWFPNPDSEVRNNLLGKAKGHSFVYSKEGTPLHSGMKYPNIYVYEFKDTYDYWRWEIVLSVSAQRDLIKTHRTEKVLDVCLDVQQTFTEHRDWFDKEKYTKEYRDSYDKSYWDKRVKTLQEALETIAAELEAARAELNYK
jgi:hypothetical protein